MTSAIACSSASPDCSLPMKPSQPARNASGALANAGYRKVCEVLSLRRRTVFVPGRCTRGVAARTALADLGLIRLAGPPAFSPHALLEAVRAELCALASQRLTPWRPTSDAIEFVASTARAMLDLEPEVVADAAVRVRRGATGGSRPPRSICHCAI